MSMYLTISVIILIFIVIVQLAKTGEYVAVLRGDEKTKKQSNKVNGTLMISFLVLGLIGVYYCNKLLKHKTLLVLESASVQGDHVDRMMWVTLTITGIVFFVTQILLFFFAYKYREDPKRKAYYFTHNHTMEIVWTAIPAIALTVLVIMGLRSWFQFTGEAPRDAMVVEVTGKQFGWIFRYPGADETFGKKYYKVIDDAKNNSLGQIWEDNKKLNLKTDRANFDDIVVNQIMYIVKNKPVKLIIGSRDVVHDVGLPHFRLKMDAVPGIPTTMWFIPKFTTKEMQEKTGNPDFQYEISCDQMCGNGHYAMKGIIQVVTQDEFNEWIAKQKSNYAMTFPERAQVISKNN